MQAQPTINELAEAVKSALASSAGGSPAALPQYDEFIAEEACRTISGLSKSERWRRVHAGTFPAPINLGKTRCTRWSLRAVLEWQRNAIVRSRAVA